MGRKETASRQWTEAGADAWWYISQEGKWIVNGWKEVWETGVRSG